MIGSVLPEYSNILQGFPGIGPARAEQLLDTFGNIEAALTASADELVQVTGIGRKTAETIRTLLSTSTPNPDGTDGIRHMPDFRP
jgi:ERCC4-type nuclease